MPLRLLHNEKDNAGAIDTASATADDNDEKGLDVNENENENASNIKGGNERPQYDSSLPLAIQRTFFYTFWLSGILYALGGTSPLSFT